MGRQQKPIKSVIAESLEQQEPNSYDWTAWVDPILSALHEAGYVIVSAHDLAKLACAQMVEDEQP